MNSQANLLTFFSRLAIYTTIILLIPLIGMQFSEDITWNLFDFIFAGALLFGTGSSFVLISRLSDNSRYRLALGIGLFTALFLVWANGAVGIIGSEDNPINLLYFGVLLILVFGALISQFKSKGLAIALFITAGAQASTIIIALLTGVHQSNEISITEIILMNGLFATLFLTSGSLFWQVKEEHSKSEFN
tara:strand:+ start:15357 stop:15926 length:570 start_codon:yes stop_codon:yes gene_type:complete